MPKQKLTDGRIAIPMRPVDIAKLDVIARRRDVPRSQIVREFIRDGLARELASTA